MKVAVITGSSKGIGSCIAKDLNNKKIKVILIARSKKLLKKIQQNLPYPRLSKIINKDLRTLSSCSFIEKKIKKIDYLINVAGATKGGEFLKLKDSDWNDGYDLKFKAALRLSKLFWKKLKKNKGNIINIGGGAGTWEKPSRTFMIGGSVNASLNHFSKTLSIQGKLDKVSVSIINPGMTLTGRLEKLLKLDAKASKKNISEILQIRLKAANLKRPTKPEEVSKLVLKLISDKNSNGKVFKIDGGIVKKQ
jgi:3-oxoacyl-[acyl-carrier protein] reductase